MPNQYQTIAVLCTAPNVEIARDIARNLVELRYAACCNIVERMTSIYYWNNELCEDQECLLVIKTSKQRYEDIERYIYRNHPYETPECVALPIIGGAKEYLTWLQKLTSSAG